MKDGEYTPEEIEIASAIGHEALFGFPNVGPKLLPRDVKKVADALKDRLPPAA